jgi:hypothetical protein
MIVAEGSMLCDDDDDDDGSKGLVGGSEHSSSISGVGKLALAARISHSRSRSFPKTPIAVNCESGLGKGRDIEGIGPLPSALAGSEDSWTRSDRVAAVLGSSEDEGVVADSVAVGNNSQSTLPTFVGLRDQALSAVKSIRI